MSRVRFVVFVCVVALTPCLLADLLEVRRDADVYREPDRNSIRVTRISLTGREGPYTLPLVDEVKANGYYRVRLPGEPIEGWIYKTFVRRYRQHHPDYKEYNRKLYQHWTDEDKDCQDTRQEVLIRDAKKGSLEFKDDKECDVKSGTWIDPYTGRTVTDPKELDVDHLVPLKNAHESGAWAWTAQRRREYANYLGNQGHLLAAGASENRKKGDKGPDRYLPPQASYQCEYVHTWVKVKSDWELSMTDEEAGTVRKLLEKCK